MARPTSRLRAGTASYALTTILFAGCAPWGPTESDLTVVEEHEFDDEYLDLVHPEREESLPAPEVLSALAPPCPPISPIRDAVELEDAEATHGGLLRTPVEGKWMGLPLRDTSFDVAVVGTVADTTVTQVFENSYDRPIEAVYVFPLPHDGAVDRYAITVGNRRIEGKIKLRNEAQEDYRKAKENGQTAGLLEQERPNIFTQTLANIPPGARVEAEIHLVQPLEQDDGGFELVLPTVVGPRFIPGAPTGRTGTGVAADTDRVPDASRISPPILPEGYRTCGDLSISVLVDAGVALRDVGSHSHAIDVDLLPDGASVELDETRAMLNKDFVLRWRTAGTAARSSMLTAPHEDGTYFTMTVHPPAPTEVERSPREVVFVLDASGSMHGTPMETSKRTIRRLLRGMKSEDAFQVLRFSENASGLGEALVPATRGNVEKALAYVDGLSGQGGTQMTEGIRAALSLPHDPRANRMVLFLTDGYIGNEREIFDIISKTVGKTRIFAMGVGDSPNRHLLDGMSRMGNGTSFYVANHEDATPIVDGIYSKLDAPALTDLQIDWGGLDVRDVVPKKLPDLFTDQPVVVYGQLGSKASGQATVRGWRGGERVEIPVRVRAARSPRLGGVRSMWARVTIDDLLMDPKLATERARYQAFVDKEVTRLSLAYSVLTDYTAFVAIDSGEAVESSGSGVTIVQGTDLVSGMASSFRSGGPGGQGLSLGNMGLIGKGGGGGGTGSGYGRGSGAGYGGRGKRVPRVRQARAVVHGSLDRAVIRRIVRAHINEVRHCYNQGLVRDPNLKGRMVITFVIDAAGKVASALVGEHTLGEEQSVGACIARAVTGWKFPRTPDGGVIQVNYPFFLSPG